MGRLDRFRVRERDALTTVNRMPALPHENPLT